MPARFLGYVKRSDLEPIKLYLDSHALGTEESQYMGLVLNESQRLDLSKQSWLHAELHFLLMQFSEKYIKPYIDFTSIQINKNSICASRKDADNVGESYIVGFGDYSGGQLCIEDANYNIERRGLLFDRSQHSYWTKDWVGCRYTLVFYTLKPIFPIVRPLGHYSAVKINNEWKLRYLDDDGDPQYLCKNSILDDM